MTRSIYSPLADKRSLTGIVPVALGGTGGITKEAATVNLSLIPHSQKGAANGILGLDSSGKYDGSNLGTMVDGPAMLYTGTSGTYKITDYHFTKSYNVSAILGNAVINHDTITYTPGAVAGSGGFTVNGVTYSVTVNTPIVATPSIVSPVNNATNMLASVTLTSNAFSTLGANDTHSASSWQVATDSAFNNVVASVTDSATALTAWIASGLLEATTYFTRCRHKGVALGNSAWSTTSIFTTKASFLPATEEAMVTEPILFSHNNFGWSVSISGDGNYCCVGSYNSTNTYIGAGKAYIFKRDGAVWALQTTLTASDFRTNDQFGISVSINFDGTTCVVGTTGNQAGGFTSSGKAFIFIRSGTTWTQQAILVSSNREEQDRCGSSVSLSADGNTCCVGAPYHSYYRGLVYIFTRSGTTWTQQAILVSSDIAADDRFGWSVSLSSDGNTCVTGAWFKTVGGISQAGKAYIFVRSGTTWTQQADFYDIVSFPTSPRFGFAVSLSGDGNTAIIGSSNANSLKGRCWIYTRSGTIWTRQAILQAILDPVSGYFGESVSLSYNGDIAVIGGSQYSLPSPSTGAVGQAYIFKRSGTTWTQQAILAPSSRLAYDYFGMSASINSDGTRVIIGANKTTGGVAQCGAAFIFA